MARFDKAHWRPIPVNFNHGGNTPRLLVVHIMQGTLAGTDSWFHNSAAQASAHFGVGKDGTIYQWVDTDDTAWHAMSANSHSIGIENEGSSGEKLTAAQEDAIAEIYAWAHKKYPAIGMWQAQRVNGAGLTWHGFGGAAWGGHTQCPGTPIVNQLSDIEAKTTALVTPPTWFALAEQDLVSAVNRLKETPADIPKAKSDIWDALARIQANAK